MRAVVQRVRAGSVSVDGCKVSAIGPGLVVFLGVGKGDTSEDAAYLAGKTAGLRIFEDEAGKLNLSVLEAGGEVLAVSQFTLYGDCRKGRRPSFTEAAIPEEADTLYRQYIVDLQALGIAVCTGVFREHMLVQIENDGPVTIMLDSHKLF